MSILIRTQVHSKSSYGIMNLFRAYERQLKHNPVKTKIASTFTLYCLGDVFCQNFLTNNKSIDFHRTLT